MLTNLDKLLSWPNYFFTNRKNIFTNLNQQNDIYRFHSLHGVLNAIVNLYGSLLRCRGRTN